MSEINPLGIINKFWQIFDLGKSCETIEQCMRDVCDENDMHPRTNKINPALKQTVDAFVARMSTIPVFKNWGDSALRAMFFLDRQGDFCFKDPVKKPKESPAPVVAAEPATAFSIEVTADDAARAAIMGAGARLVYDVLMFGATVCPPARPATQGLMMLLGITPPSFSVEKQPLEA